MKTSIRGMLVLILVLALPALFGGALAAEPDVPEIGEAVVYNASVEETDQVTVAMPRASQKAGTYTSSVKVKLTTGTQSAKIYYTTNGTKPTKNSKEYTKTLTVKKNVTIKAVAIKSGKASSVLTVEYKIRAATPKVNKTAGKYADSVSVKLTSETADVKIYYTTDGSTPTQKSTLYSKAIKLTKTTTIKAIALKSNMTKSKVVSAKYTVFKYTYTKRNGYLACTANEKKAYKALYDGMAAVEKEIHMPVKIKVPAALRVMMRVKLDNPELIAWGQTVTYFYDGDYMLSMLPKYVLTKKEQTEIQKAMKTAAEKIANKARKETKTAAQIKVIHDQLVLGAEYDMNAFDTLIRGGYVPSAHNAYGVLVDKIGVCESYSRAFQYVCQLMGISAITVVGNAGGDHMWNMVKIGDNWYHIDLTWDDPLGYGEDYVEYSYFLISDSKIKATHTVSSVAKGNQGMSELRNYSAIPKASKSYNINALSAAA